MTGKTKELEIQKDSLLKNKEIWLRTDSLAKEEEAPEDILKNVDDILIKFNNVDSIFSTRIYTLLSLQSDLSKQIVEIESILKNIKEELLERQREIFVQNAPPIWESLSDTKDTSNILLQVNQIWNSHYRTLNKFYEKNKDNIFDKLIFFILLLLFIFGLKHYSKNISSDELKVKRTLEILKRPLTIIWRKRCYVFKIIRLIYLNIHYLPH